MGRPEGVPPWKPIFRTLAVKYYDERVARAERRNEFLIGQGLCGFTFEKRRIDYFDKTLRSHVELDMSDVQLALTENIQSILCVPLFRRSVPFRVSPIAVFSLDSPAGISATRFNEPALQEFVANKCHLIEEILD